MKRILYKLGARGQVLQFEVQVSVFGDDQSAILITTKGQYGGAMQRDEKIFNEGKNLGRANETTPSGQAKNEAEGIINKLLDKGYKELAAVLMQPAYPQILEWLHEQGKGTDASGNLKPMLAQKDPRKITFPCFAQRKYDGVRCFTFIKDGEATMFSRNGKESKYLGHIKRDLKNWFADFDVIVDGELYSHQMTFQKIISAVKREQAANKDIELRIYDLIPLSNLKMVQAERMQLLIDQRLQLRKANPDVSFEFVKTWVIEDKGEMQDKFAMFLAQGYEGLMARLPQYYYEFGVRSHGLIKVKEYDEDEFTIIGVDEATGRDEGTAVFIMQEKGTGIIFRARPMGDRELRADYYNNKEQYIGKIGTVKYQGKSEDGIPRFPVMKGLRDYE